MPDGLIVGILGLLLGTTGAVWLATEAAEFATHGHAPRPLRFSATPVAIRHLATAPNDLPAAWPGTPAGQLPSPTAFWVSFFLLLAALLLLFLATLALRARFFPPPPRAGAAPVPPQRTATPGARPPKGATASAAWPAPPATPGGRPAPEPPSAAATALGGQGHTTDRAQPGPRDAAAAWGAAPAPGEAEAWGAAPPPHAPGEAEAWGGAPTAGGHTGVAPRRAASYPDHSPATDRAEPSPEGAEAWGAAPLLHAPSGGEGSGAAPLLHAPSGGEGSGAAPLPHAPSGGEAWGGAPHAPSRAEASGAAPLPHAPSGGEAWDRAPTAWGHRGAEPASADAAAFGGQVQGGGRAEPGAGGSGARGGVTCVVVAEVGARGAKREVLAEVARKAAGALVVVTADTALWEQRPAHRDAALFDPSRLLGDPPGLAWAPEADCADPGVAAARARALLAPTLRPGADRADAEALLAGWLESAAREGRSIRHVARRAAKSGAPEPVRAALACLEELHVLKSCLPTGSPQDSLDLDAVLQGRRPLYLLGPASEIRVRPADHSTMPLLTALLDALLGRLSPGTTLVLDDVAAVAPAPGLPALADLGVDADVTTVLTLRSFEQARARWSEDAVHSLWTKASRRATLQQDRPGEPHLMRESPSSWR